MKTSTWYLIIIILIFYDSSAFYAQESKLSQDNFTFPKSGKHISISPRKIPQPITTNNYDLKYHRFNWVIDPAQLNISGSVTSYFVATQQAMNSIQFQLNASLSADSALFAGKTVTINHTGDLITIPLDPVVSLGNLDSLTVYYHGVPGLSGFGSFKIDVHNEVPCMWTLSEPYGAYDWWPSKNDLTDKIDSIDVFVVVPKGNHAASNGILVSETAYDANSTIAHWKHRYPIASYLVAIAVSNYARYSDYYKSGSDSIEILNYVYPEDSAVLRPVTTDVISTMALFEKLFSPYPFSKEKFGHAQCNISGGMEHQTMTFLGKNSFNHFIMTHELAHQWFGDMITCGSWEDIWLNEGFATYSLLLSYEFLFNDNYYFKTFRKNIWDEVILKQQGSVFCNDTTSVPRIFSGSLSYYKGAALLHMIRWIVGEKDFFQAIRNYLNDPKLIYSFARTADLKKHFEDQSGKDLTEFFADWFYGSGLPNYKLLLNQQSDLASTIAISQTQYNSDVSFFNMLLAIKFKGAEKDTTIIFNHSYSGQTFDFNPEFKIDSVFFDPENKILYNQYEFAMNQATLNQVASEDTILISPNPVKDFLQVRLKTKDVNFIGILNVDGKLQNTFPAKQENSLLEFDIQQLQPGVYILRLGNSEWTETRKFIVIK